MIAARLRRWPAALRVAALLPALWFPAGALAQALDPQLATNKGCQETGQDPSFAVGEQIRVTFRIDSSSLSEAAASILDYTPDGRIAIISFGAVATNRTYSFLGRIGGAAGVETLVLRATSPGVTTQRSSCTFTVAGGTPAATRTSTRTRTPTPSRTPQGSATVTRTPGGDLSGELTTTRGCRENGDTATFAIGESIIVSLRLASDSAPRADASVVDMRGSSAQTVFSFGSVPTNVPLSFGGRVGAPIGVHTLRLRASLSGFGTQQTLDTCSFLVEGAAATPTRTASRTRTPTRTPSAMRTRTPTRTATPLPGTDRCIGACTDGVTVSVNDLLTVIEIAAGRTALAACPVADADGDDQVSLDEVLQAVNNALDGCANQ